MPLLLLLDLLVLRLLLLMVLERRRLVDHRVETAVLVGGVLDGPYRTVRFDDAVLALDDVAVSRFLLALDVTGVVVADAVFEAVLGGRLEIGGVLKVTCGLERCLNNNFSRECCFQFPVLKNGILLLRSEAHLEYLETEETLPPNLCWEQD